MNLKIYETMENALLAHSPGVWRGFKRVMTSDRLPQSFTSLRHAYMRMLRRVYHLSLGRKSPWPALGAAFGLCRVAARRDSEIAEYWFLDLMSLFERYEIKWPRVGVKMDIEKYNRYNRAVYEIMGHPDVWLTYGKLGFSEDGRALHREKSEVLFEILENITLQYEGASSDGDRCECFGTAYFVWRTLLRRENWQELDVRVRKVMWPMVKDFHTRCVGMKYTPWYNNKKVTQMLEKRMGF